MAHANKKLAAAYANAAMRGTAKVANVRYNMDGLIGFGVPTPNKEQPAHRSRVKKAMIISFGRPHVDTVMAGFKHTSWRLSRTRSVNLYQYRGKDMIISMLDSGQGVRK